MTQPIGGSFKPFAAACLALFAVAAGAADRHWIAAGAGDWSTIGNWDYQRVPTSADDVYIDNGGTPEVASAGQTAAQLFLTDGGLDLLSGDLTCSGNASIGVNAGESADVTVSGGSSLTLGQLCFSGNGGNATMEIIDGTVTSNGGGGGTSIGADDTYPLCGTNAVSSSRSSLLVYGANSAFYSYSSSGNFATIGGNVAIQNGGRMEVHNSNVLMGSRANILVDGTGSLFFATGSYDYGIGGFGGQLNTDPMPDQDTSITVANGGRFELRIYFQSDPVQINPGVITAEPAHRGPPIGSTHLNIGTGGAPGFFDIATVNSVWGGLYITFDHDAPDYYFTSTGTAAGTPIRIGVPNEDGAVDILNEGPGTTILTGPMDLPGAHLMVHHGKLVFDGVAVTGPPEYRIIEIGLPEYYAEGELALIDGATIAVEGVDVGTNDATAGPAVLRVDGNGSALDSTYLTAVSRTGSVIVSNGGLLDADAAEPTELYFGGQIDIGAPAGQPPAAPGRFTGALDGYVAGGNYVDGNIVINHTATRYVLSDGTNTLLITPGNALTHLAGDTYIETANTYDNSLGKGTTISGGTLSVFDVGAGASALGTAPVLVNGTGTLGGGGEVPSVHLASGGALDPSYPDDPNLPFADPFGTLTIAGDLQMDAGSRLRFDANRSGVGAGYHANDYIAVNGNATLGGVVDIIPGPLADFLINGNIVMMTYTGTLSGTLAIGSSPPGFACTIDTTSTPGEVLLHMVPATTPAVSLSVTDAGGGYAPYGQTATYTVTLTNNDSASVTDIALTSTLSTALYATNATWTCQGSGGASCPAASGGGALFGTGIALPVGGSLTWTVNVPVLDAAQQDSASFSAGATYAGTVASDDTLVLFRDGFDGN